MPLATLSSSFQSLPHYPQANWALLVLLPGVWAYVHSRTLWVSPVNAPVRLGVSPAAASTPTGVFNQWFEALFTGTGALGCKVCLTPQLFLLVYPYANVGPPAPPAATLLQVLSTWLPISTPPFDLDECFFFKSLVVKFPYSSIFWQFWLFFVFKFVVVLLVVQGGSVSEVFF